EKKRFSFLTNHYLYIGLLALITITLYSQFLFSDKMLYSSDQLGGLDSRSFYREALVNQGQFPEWFSCRLGGMPSIDASFGDAFYPPSLLIHMVMPVHRALGMKMVLHVILAGLFFYLLLVKGFGASPLVGFIGAALYMLNPQFISHTYPGHDGKMFVIAWLPFVLWRLKSLLEKPNLVNSLLLSIGIAMCLLTSHVQLTYFMLWGLFLYWVMHLVLQWRGHKQLKPLVPAAGYFWLAVFAGLAIAFVQLYPTFMFVRGAFSVRGVDRGFDFASSWSLHWPEFFSLWVPEFGNWLDYYWGNNPFKLNTEYAGVMVTLFGAVGIISRPKPWRIFWGTLAVLAVLYSLGANTPVFHIAYYLIPGVKKFRAASMMMFWFSFALSLLSGLFFMDVVRGRFNELEAKAKSKWKRGIFVAAGAITLIALIFSAKGFVSSLMGLVIEGTQKQRIFEVNFEKNFLPMLWLWWLFSLAGLGVLWGAVTGKLNKYAFLVIVLGIGIIDAARVDSQFIKVVSARPYFNSDPALVELSKKMESDPFRCFTLPGTLPQNSEGVHDLEGITGFHDNELRWYREFRGDQSNRNFLQSLVEMGADGKAYLVPSNLRKGNNFLNLANARYILTRQGGRIVPVENESALGRISFVPGYTVMKEDEIIKALQEGAYDIRHKVALLEEPSRKPAPFVEMDSTGVKYPSYTVNWDKYTVNHRKATVTTDRDGFLRISEVYYPGWKVLVDGNPANIYKADYAWMAAYIPAGTHEVEMMPESLYLGTASLISFPALFAVLIYFGIWGALNIKRRKESSDSKS
ncbi:MAG: YfhO family protein, partial [Chitinivibrionales bacterium]|nr:YfhO family protein [Chitinivibrionales bacterium]